MRYAPRALLAGGLGFAVSFVAACGGGAGLLSADSSASLNNQLDRVASLVQAGQCTAAAGAVATVGTQVAALPNSVNRTLRRNLQQGVKTTKDLVETRCRPATPTRPTQTKTQPTTPTNTNTTPTNTNTTPTNTITTPTNTTPTSTQPPATTGTGPGTTSTGSSGGAGFGGHTTGGTGPPGGNGNGNGQ
jgi:hypothetical protein